MKWFLVWLIVITGPDGKIETHLYETRMTDSTACYEAQGKLDDKLILGYDNFTTSCEYR